MIPDTTGPISFFREEGDPQPIVPISSTIGWRRGEGRTTYIGFRQEHQHKPVALAFDEPRLLEAIGTLIEATAAYPDGTGQIVITPEAMSIAPVPPDGLALLFRLADGGRFGVTMTRNNARRLVGEMERFLSTPPNAT